jgi:tetratricopeptide (TPR) repeat protein
MIWMSRSSSIVRARGEGEGGRCWKGWQSESIGGSDRTCMCVWSSLRSVIVSFARLCPARLLPPFARLLAASGIAAVATPNSAQLWNNIGMCFFGKQRYVAAIACLKRALYLDPFEWIISYNLGLVHLNTDQYASAFHYLSASINLKPDFPSSYMYLGITLSRLDDFENACSAYEKAIRMERYEKEWRDRAAQTTRGRIQASEDMRVITIASYTQPLLILIAACIYVRLSRRRPRLSLSLSSVPLQRPSLRAQLLDHALQSQRDGECTCLTCALSHCRFRRIDVDAVENALHRAAVCISSTRYLPSHRCVVLPPCSLDRTSRNSKHSGPNSRTR